MRWRDDLKPSSELFVKKEARELGSTRPLQELDKDLSEGALEFISSFLELLAPHKMGLVVVGLELLKQSLKLNLVQIVVDFSVEKGLHLIKVGGVEPWCQKCLLDGFLSSGLFGLRRR